MSTVLVFSDLDSEIRARTNHRISGGECVEFERARGVRVCITRAAQDSKQRVTKHQADSVYHSRV
jgi:hypothetical protein